MPNRKKIRIFRRTLLLVSLGVIGLVLQESCFLAAQSANTTESLLASTCSMSSKILTLPLTFAIPSR